MNAINVMLGRAALYVLLLLQFWLSWNYWGSFDATGEWRAPGGFSVFQIAGVALVAIEAAIWIWRDKQKRLGNKGKSRFLGSVFYVVFAVNWVSDIGAVSTFLAGEHASRIERAQAYDVQERQLERERDTAQNDADDYRRQLVADGMYRPVAALQSELAAQNEDDRRWRAAYGADALLPRDYADTRRRLESALAMAEAMNSARTTVADTMAQLEGLGARIMSEHPAFANLARLLNMLGVGATASDVSAILALALAVLIKLWIAFGFWATAEEPGAPLPAATPSGRAGVLIEGFASPLRWMRRRILRPGAVALGAVIAIFGIGTNAAEAAGGPAAAPSNAAPGTGDIPERDPIADATLAHVLNATPVAIPDATSDRTDDATSALSQLSATAERDATPQAPNAKSPARKPRFDAAIIERAVQRYRAGDHVDAIAADAGCDRASVYRWLGRAGEPKGRERRCRA